MITLFLFVKGTATTEIENLIAQAQMAASLDTIERLQSIPEIDTIVVSTASETMAARAESLGVHVELDAPGIEFHFGTRLSQLVRQYRADVPLYVGGGSGALMQVEDWRRLVQTVLSQENCVVPNNYFSCDWAAWSPGNGIDRIEPPSLDNDLAYRLGERAGLRVLPLPKNAASQFDVDTPTDLACLSFRKNVGRHLRSFLDSVRLETSRVEQIRQSMRSPAATLMIAGRVSASMALFLERETRCQWRIFSEERGMRASGRQERGEVRSLLGIYLESVGANLFFASLAPLADGLVLDSRVLFAHRRLQPSAPDRFYSDLLQPEKITDPFIREWTAAARSASFPVILGGHSVVSGGMYALAE